MDLIDLVRQSCVALVDLGASSTGIDIDLIHARAPVGDIRIRAWDPHFRRAIGCAGSGSILSGIQRGWATLREGRNPQHPEWTHERVSVDAGYGGGPLDNLPAIGRPAYHARVHTPAIVPGEGLRAATKAFARIVDEVNRLDFKDLRSPAEGGIDIIAGRQQLLLVAACALQDSSASSAAGVARRKPASAVGTFDDPPPGLEWAEQPFTARRADQSRPPRLPGAACGGRTLPRKHF
jgi:hypothetical protein